MVELLVVVGVFSILLAIGFVGLNTGSTATSQAAQVVSAAVNRARFEAIRSSTTAGIRILGAADGDAGRVLVCGGVDETQTLSCATGTVIFDVRLSEGDLARAMIASPQDVTVFFDRRGLIRNLGSLTPVVITDRSGSNTRTVDILSTGRTEVR